jgi:hypothetical protein
VTDSRLTALEQRWASFVDKVRARVREIAGEAEAAYLEVIATDVIDGTALSGVSSAIKARLIALRQKIDESWRTIDKQYDNLDGIDARTLGRFRGKELAIAQRFGREVERATEDIIVRGEAEAARALLALAEQERAVEVRCAHCGAPVARPVESWSQTINVPCPSCRAVVSVTPGSAATMFVRGTGAIALARDASHAALHALQDAENAWRRLRKKTLDDLARFEAAHRAYWQAYADAMARVLPGWGPERSNDEVRGKMSWFYDTTAKDDRTVRENYGAGVAAAATGDPARVQQWLSAQGDRARAGEDLLEAMIERGWNDRALWVAQVAGLSATTVDDAFYYFETRGDT